MHQGTQIQGKKSRSTQQTGERSAEPQANTMGSNTHPKKPEKPANKESQAEKQVQNA
ncbi:hypothetical protein FRX31_026817, partial [Thalictrum thalictroides]